MFLVQITYDDDSTGVSLMNELELIRTTNETDFNGISDMEVYDVSEFGKINHLKYLGWQPNCLIQYKDNEGNIVVSGYGEDH